MGLVGRYLIFSAPLLAVLALMHVCFTDEPEVYAYFTALRAGHPVWTAALKAVSNWMIPLFYGVYGAAFLAGFVRNDKRLIRLGLAYLAMELLVSLLLVRGLKMAIGRPRPDAGNWFMPFTTEPSHHSLPSGHTTEATLSAMPLALRCRGWAATLAMGLILAAMGFSRIYLGWHHPTDVLCGWMLGSVGGLAVHVLAGGRR